MLTRELSKAEAIRLLEILGNEVEAGDCGIRFVTDTGQRTIILHIDAPHTDELGELLRELSV